MQTWLFAPGHEDRKVRKAVASAADFVIVDWEDAVPPSERETARQVTQAIADEESSLGVERLERLCVRINHPETPDYALDVEALVDRQLAYLVVPKIETVEQVKEVAGLGRPLFLILESALGVERAFELLSADPLVRYVGFGPLDFLADLGGTWTLEGEETLFARSRIALAARAAGLAGAIDGPFPRIKDVEALERDTARVSRMGYVGRMALHPIQLEPIERAFAPTETDLAFARRVLEAADQGQLEGKASISVDGRFVDPPVIKWANKVLATSS